MQKDILLIGGVDRLPLYQDACGDEQVVFRTVSNLHGALESLKEKLPTLILVDHDALGSQSLEICQTFKKYPATQRLPLVFIISRNNWEDLMVALYIPVDDYLFFPLDPEDFKYRIQAQFKLLEFKDKKRLISVEEKIQELEKLVEIFPEYNAARQELADIYEKIGAVEKALESNLKLAKQYYYENNFGQAMDMISKMKNMMTKQSLEVTQRTGEFLETMERCLQILTRGK